MALRMLKKSEADGTGQERQVGGFLGVGGIELWALVEVVAEGFLGGLFCLPTAGPHGEFGLM